MSDIVIEKLHPQIWVFKNGFSFSDELIKLLESKEGWTSWYTFGSKIPINVNQYRGDKFPSIEEWHKEVVGPCKDEALKEFVKAFHNATSQYVSSLNIELEKWIFEGSDLAKYNANSGVDEVKAMNYHTDHRLGRVRFPGPQFEITAVSYLNDGYDGGEICFRVFNDEFTELVHEFDYKPSKGDIIVFPSKHPFYHGVKIVKSGQKYILRSYWRSYGSGDPKLLEQKEKFLLTHTEEEWEKLAQKKENELFDRYQRRIQIITKEDPNAEDSELDTIDVSPYSINYEE